MWPGMRSLSVITRRWHPDTGPADNYAWLLIGHLAFVLASDWLLSPWHHRNANDEDFSEIHVYTNFLSTQFLLNLVLLCRVQICSPYTSFRVSHILVVCNLLSLWNGQAGWREKALIFCCLSFRWSNILRHFLHTQFSFSWDTLFLLLRISSYQNALSHQGEARAQASPGSSIWVARGTGLHSVPLKYYESASFILLIRIIYQL